MVKQESTPEQQPSPKEELIKYLEGEKPGSIKVLAMVDICSYRIAGAIRHSQFIPPVEETIRIRTYGENGDEYRKAWRDAKRIIGLYQQRYPKGYKTQHPFCNMLYNILELLILDDLDQIIYKEPPIRFYS